MTMSAGLRTPTAPGELPLTPRQKQVLDLLVERKTNAEIGASLGISLDGAKWHVTEVIGRLGVDNREEAADFWRHYNGLPARLSRVWRAAVGLPFLKWFGFAAVGGATVGAAVVGALIIYNQANQTQPGVSEGPDAATSVPGISSPVGSGSAGAGAPTSITATIGAPQGLPANTAMYVIDGCWACDAPPTGLVRYAADGAGQVTRDRVSDSIDLGAGEQLLSFSVREDGRVLTAVACAASNCSPGLGGTPDSNARTRIITSGDGGATWSELKSFQGGIAGVVGFSNEAIIASVYTRIDNGRGETRYELLGNSARALDPPPGAVQGGEGFAYPPALLLDGTVIWLSGDARRVLREDGSVFLDPRLNEGARIGQVRQTTDGRTVLEWRLSPQNQPPTTGVSLYRADGAIDRTVSLGSTTWFVRLTSSPGTVYVGLESASVSGAGNRFGLIPALLDVESGTITPVFGNFLASDGRNYPQAIFPIS